MKIDKGYLVRAFCINPIDIFNRMMKTDSGKIAYKRTGYVLKVSLLVYIPLVILCVFLFARYNYIALPVWLLVILSAFPFAKYIMIPLSEKKRTNIEESVRKQT